MLTLVLVLAAVLAAVGAGELVRSWCQQMLRRPLRISRRERNQRS